jgi:hypothetical protein
MFVSLLRDRRHDVCVFVGVRVDADSDRTIGFVSFVRRHVLHDRSLQVWHGDAKGQSMGKRATCHTIPNVYITHQAEYTERSGIYWVFDSPCVVAVEVSVGAVQFTVDTPSSPWGR